MKGVLKLLLCVEKTLSAEEILGAVALNQQGQRIFSNPMDIVRMSRSFVVLDQSSKEFRFAHLSVKEFLEKHVDFSAEISQSAAAQMCLSYLLRVYKSSNQIGSEEPGDRFPNLRPGSLPYPFLMYANKYWPRHCQKAGSQRFDGELKVLMTEFLLEADMDKPVFKRWNHVVRSKLGFYYEDRKLFKEHRHSASFPANALFVTCTYGFDEFVDSLMNSETEVLLCKNTAGMNALEVCAYNGHYELTKRLLSCAQSLGSPDIWGKSLIVRAARGCPDVKVMEYLLSELQGVEITLATLIAAAKNEKSGAQTMDLLLSLMRTGIHSSMIEVIGENCRSTDAIQFLHSRFKGAFPPKIMLAALFTNPNVDLETLGLAVKDFDGAEITEDLVVELLSGTYDDISKERFEVLFSHNTNCPTTSRSLRAAQSCNKDTFAYLCSRCSGTGWVEEVVVEAMRNQEQGKAVAVMLIENNDIDFTDWSLEKACVVPVSGPDCLDLLLRKPGSLAFGPDLLATVSRICTSETRNKLLLAFPENEISKTLLRDTLQHGHDHEVQLILHQPRAFSIGEKDLYSAVSNCNVKLARTIMQNIEQVRPSEELMISVVKNAWSASKLLHLFSEKFQTLPVTHEVLKEAVIHCPVGAFKLIEQLFEFCPQQNVTEELLCAGANSNLEVMTFLMQRKGSVEVSETLIKAAIPNGQKASGSVEILRMLLPFSRTGTPTTAITVSVLELAFSISDEETVELLVSAEPSLRSLEKADQLLVAAAGNSGFGQGTSILQLVVQADKTNVPNEAWLAAARNEGFEKEGYHILNRLFAVSHEVNVKEDLVAAAAANNRSATALMELLISHTEKLPITEGVMIAAASNHILGESILRLLIDYVGADVNITTPILIAAAENGRCGFHVLKALLPYIQGGKLPQEVANAAAKAEPMENFFLPSYWWSGQPILRFVLKQPAISITEDLLRFAAGNKYSGLQFVRLLLAHPKNQLPLSQRIVESAVCNPIHGDLIMKHLLEKRSDEIPLNKEIVTAVPNDACGKLVLQRLLGLATDRKDHRNTNVIFKAITREENGLRDALFQAAYRDQAAALHVLIDGGADVNAANYDIGTALHVAAFKGQFLSTKALVERRVDVNAVGGPHRTALAAACQRSKVEIVRYLANQGAEIEVSDDLGRTNLHRALQSSNIALTDCLLELGASVLTPDISGCPAICHAIRVGFHHGLEQLIELGSSVSTKDTAGWMPLHWAARKGDFQIVESLIQADANIKVTNNQGQMPLEIAVFFGNDHLCQMLCDASEILEYPRGQKSDKNGVAICNMCDMASSPTWLS